MTTMTAGFTTDLAQIRAQAARVRFIPVLVTCLVWPFAALFTVIGWAVGSLWYVAVLGALTVAYGFCKGAHIEVRAKAPEPPSRQLSGISGRGSNACRQARASRAMS